MGMATKRLAWWRLALPLSVQVGLVLLVPLPHALIRANGTTVFLETAPVDPYDLLRGRYIRLGYALEDRSLLETLPGWEASQGEEVIFITIRGDSDPDNPERPQAWEAVRLDPQPPGTLAANERVIRARNLDWRYSLDLSEYYIPEAIGDALEDDMFAHPEEVLVEAKVDAQGNSVLTRMWIQDRRY